MQRHRVLIAFGIAWASALLLSYWVYTKSTAPEVRDVVPVVVAARDLPLGARLQQDNVKLVTVERRDLPRGVFQNLSDLADRALAVPVAANEMILSGKLAPKGSGEGLTALIELGARAVSVQINEVSGVAGFIQPGTRVDILFTRIFSNGDAATTTLLQNVKVIAYGRQFEPGARPATADASRATVATLLVTQEEAEKLVLAAQRGRLHFSLRNGLDDGINEPSAPIESSDLGIDDPRKPVTPARPAGPTLQTGPVVPPVPPPPPPPKPTIVQIFRAEKMTEITLK